MQTCLICDFETRSRVDIRTAGAWAYAQHPSTDVLCLGIGNENMLGVLNPIELECNNVFRRAVENPDILLVAHNAMFEIAIYNEVLVRRYGYPEIPISRWCCTMARAVARGLPPSLKLVAKELGLKEEKDSKGELLIRYMCRPKKDGSFAWNPELQAQMESYCLQDIKTELELHKTLPMLQEYERKVWELDQLINMRGVKVDIQAVSAVIDMLEREDKCLQLRVKELGQGYFDTTNQRDKVIKWLRARGIVTDTLRIDDVKRIISETKDEEVKELLTIRQAQSKTSNAKYTKMLEAVGSGDRIRGMFRYHGAATGRFSGALVQLQNLPRKKVSDVDKALDALYSNDTVGLCEATGAKTVNGACSAMIRSMLIPSDGKKFLVSDYAGIEARGIMWLAGQEDALHMFNQGIDIYKEMAVTVFNLNGVDEVTPEQRQLGKTVILGAGYGMSAAKFEATCASWGMNVSAALAEKAIQSYRTRFSLVPKFWYGLENAVKLTIKTGESVQCGKVWIKQVKGDCLMRLPSGRIITYRKMRNERDKLKYRGVKNGVPMWVDTYSGKLAENCTQAICRDLFVESMIRLEAAGFNIVMHVHDEVVAEIDNIEGGLDAFNRWMALRPSWAAGFPISVEGWEGTRYKK